jgi:hypothetical protein
LIQPPAFDFGIPATGLSLVYSSPPARAATKPPAMLDTRSGEALLTTSEAAAMLSMSPRTLEGLRRKGGGPDFIALSRNLVRYQPAALKAWIASRAVPHTAKARSILAA